MGCLWRLLLKPNTGGDLRYQIHRQARCHFKRNRLEVHLYCDIELTCLQQQHPSPLQLSTDAARKSGHIANDNVMIPALDMDAT